MMKRIPGRASAAARLRRRPVVGARDELGQAHAAEPRGDVGALSPRDLAKYAFRISHC